MKIVALFFPKASIGTYLVAMAVAIALPIFAFVALLLLQLEDNQRSTLKRETAQDALALSRIIDRQLQDMATTLRLLRVRRSLKTAISLPSMSARKRPSETIRFSSSPSTAAASNY